MSNEKLLKASYLAALRVTRAMKPYIITKDLINFFSNKWHVRNILDGECTLKLKEIPLSYHTISRRTGEMSSDIKAQNSIG